MQQIRIIHIKRNTISIQKYKKGKSFKLLQQDEMKQIKDYVFSNCHQPN